MTMAFNSFDDGASPVVYVRQVTVATLPDALQAEIGPIETVYSVHRPDGERLAVVRDRDLAFILARQHDFAPVSVH